MQIPHENYEIIGCFLEGKPNKPAKDKNILMLPLKKKHQRNQPLQKNFKLN